jgi:hypothetical protein
MRAGLIVVQKGGISVAVDLLRYLKQSLEHGIKARKDIMHTDAGTIESYMYFT